MLDVLWGQRESDRSFELLAHHRRAVFSMLEHSLWRICGWRRTFAEALACLRGLFYRPEPVCPQIEWSMVPPSAWAALLWAGIVATAGAHSCIAWAISRRRLGSGDHMLCCVITADKVSEVAATCRPHMSLCECQKYRNPGQGFAGQVHSALYEACVLPTGSRNCVCLLPPCAYLEIQESPFCCC